MAQLTDAFLRDKENLSKVLQGAQDPKAVGDLLADRLEQYRAEASSTLTTQPSRLVLNRLCAVATEGCRMISVVSQAEITQSALPAEKKSKRSIGEWLRFLPSVLSAVLTAMLLMSKLFDGAGVAFAACVLGYVFAAKPPKADVSAMQAAPQIDVTETLRRFEMLLRVTDESIVEEAPSPRENTGVSRNMMESVQMLMEAHLTHDGSFALRTIPQLADAMGREGIVMCMYSDNNLQYFDLLPAEKGGETIRPALLKDGVLLARGQATIAIGTPTGRK